MNVLPSMLRLSEVSGVNVCVLLLSEIVWEKFRTGSGVMEPLVIHFPDYTRGENSCQRCQGMVREVKGDREKSKEDKGDQETSRDVRGLIKPIGSLGRVIISQGRSRG